MRTVTPQFYIPTFYVFCNLIYFLYGLGQMPMRTIFPRFDTSFKWCQQKGKIGVLLHTYICIYIYIYICFGLVRLNIIKVQTAVCVCVCLCGTIQLGGPCG
jgi:hypothetical protein